MIHIPEGQQQVLILGEVRNPGYYRFNLGDRVLDAVGYAGGLLPQAAAQDVTLTRQEDGQAQIHSLDLEELMQNRFLSNNLPLQAGISSSCLRPGQERAGLRGSAIPWILHHLGRESP